MGPLLKEFSPKSPVIFSALLKKNGAIYRTLRCGNYIILFIMGGGVGKGKKKLSSADKIKM
jgi:hypothetical protein